MSPAELRQKVKAKIDTLTPARLRSAAELLDLLDARKSNRATVELLEIPGLVADVRQGLKDIHAGRSTPVEKLRRKYR